MQMIKHIASGILLILLLTSCRFVTTGLSGVPEMTPTPVAGALSTIARPTTPPLQAPLATSSQITEIIPQPTAAPTFMPTLSPSAAATAQSQTRFRDLRFAITPDIRPQQVFPAGTEEIFAVWEYRDMAAGDRIRRIWFRDDQIWLTREENWNWNHYGESGTVVDISVYDNEGSGLDPGNYRLQLYVNDTLQQEGSFTVLAQ